MTKNDDITIVGRAENAKAGAVVVSSDEKLSCYVDGFDYWDEIVIGMMVKVSGKLFLEKKELKRLGDIPAQQIVGEKRIIQRPKWEMVR